jgi:hypothetical protein
MPMFEFTAHRNQSLFGQGTELEARKLTQLMNIHRDRNAWDFRETDSRVIRS